MGIKEVSDDLLEDLLRKERGFIVLEFWSPGCLVCAQMEPELQRAMAELKDEAMFYRINTDRNARLAGRFGVNGTPTFVFLCKGRKLGEYIGFMSSTALRNTVRDLIRYHSSCPSRYRNYDIDGYG